MTDQNTNPSDRNDPNRPSDDGYRAGSTGGGNASGSQFPTGQPGEYVERDATPPQGQFGQPGEYSGGPEAQHTPSYGPPQPQPGAGVAPPLGYGQTSTTGQYPAAPSPMGQNTTGQYATGQYPAGQFGSGQQQTDHANGGPFDQASFTEQPSRQPRPRTDENGEPYGVGPFTLREAIVAGLAVLLLIASFLPLIGGEYAEFVGYSNLWGPAPWLVIPGALVFIAAAALLVLRRLVPAGPSRIGSLSVDQFASAAAIVTAGFHLGAILLMLGLGVWFGGLNEGFAPGAGPILGLVVSLAAVALTTFAVFIPPFAADFRDRPESSAHRLARAAKPVPQRPKSEAQPQQSWTSTDGSGGGTATAAPAGATGPVAGWTHQEPSDPWPGAVTPEPTIDRPDDTAANAAPATAVYEVRESQHEGSGDIPTAGDPTLAASSHDHAANEPVAAFGEPTRVDEPVEAPRREESATALPTDEHPVAEPSVDAQPVAEQPVFAPYWVLAPEQRPVVDLTTGAPLFEVGPTAWSLAVGERDGGLVIRADDGRVGLLRAVDGLTRG